MKKIEINAKGFKVDNITTVELLGFKELEVPKIDDGEVTLIVLDTKEVPTVSGAGALIATSSFKKESESATLYGRKCVVFGKDFMSLSKTYQKILIHQQFIKFMSMEEIIEKYNFIKVDRSNPSTNVDKEIAARIITAKLYGLHKERQAYTKKEMYKTKSIKETVKKINTINKLVEKAIYRLDNRGVIGFVVSGFMTMGKANEVFQEYSEYVPEETIEKMVSNMVDVDNVNNVVDMFSAIDISKISPEPSSAN